MDVTCMLRMEMTLDQAADHALSVLPHTTNGRFTAAEALRHDAFVPTKLYRSASEITIGWPGARLPADGHSGSL